MRVGMRKLVLISMGRRAQAAGVAALLAQVGGQAIAQRAADVAATAASARTVEEVVVTARHRVETAQDVPVPVSVIDAASVERHDVKSVWEVPQLAPNIGVVGDNARKVSISIRGIGRNGANDSAESSVSTIVDGVPLFYAGQAWANYVDLERIEVLRGPQGTLLGKNSTLGAVSIVTRAPTFEPEASYQVEVGSRKSLQGRFSSSGPLVDDKLAYRASFFVDRANGQYENVFQSDETWNEKNRIGTRLQLLVTPGDRIRNRTILDYMRSDERVNLVFPLSDGPSTYADGTPRTSSYVTRFAERRYFDNADGTPYRPFLGTTVFENAEARPQQTSQHGISNQLEWTLGSGHTLTSISAFRRQTFDIKNGGLTRFYINNGGQQLWNEQLSQEVRIASPAGGRVDYQAGIYYLDARVYSDDPTYFGEDAGAWYATDAQYRLLYDGVGAGGPGGDLPPGIGRELLRDSLKGMYQSTVTDARLESLAAFGQLDWHATDRLTLTFGVRYTVEHKTNRIRQELDRPGVELTAERYPGATPEQLAAAQAIRSRRIEAPYDWIDGTPIDEDFSAWLVGADYSLGDNVMLYVSASQGVKAGFIYFPNGFQPGDESTRIRPEEAFDVELGVKSDFLGGRLRFNANLYRTKVSDYQTEVAYIDPLDETEVRTRWENADGITATGIEYEVRYALPRLPITFTLNGARNDATYERYLTTCPDLPPPVRLCDYSGRQVHSAPKRQINTGLDYEVPLGGGALRVWLHNSHRSGTYLAASQSEFTYEPAYDVLLGGIGYVTPDDKYEISLVGRNLTDEDYAITRSTYSDTSPVRWIAGEERYVGVRFRGRLSQ